ncbi:MAG: hypothetical protein KAS51_07595 [Candidatus Omnitrophica bacterium]|nr:hypothetical protein [Candidatus Omnitrophota bacterium]
MIKKISFIITISFFVFYSAYSAPCYGTRSPEKGKFFGGFQSHSILNRHLEAEYGEVRSNQHFFQLSYGVYDWLSLDLKAGVGNIKQHPLESDEIDYPSAFAGGYGFRIKFYDNEKIKMVFGFHHISVHPEFIHLDDQKNKAILDDWQLSLLASYDYNKIVPYGGIKWSRLDYIHWIGDDRSRRMSNLTQSLGVVCGFDIPLNQKLWINVEGQFIETEALAISFNFAF